MAQPTIFVSHSHEDNAFGVKLVEDLRRALGDDDAVWYDTRGGLKGGDDWWSKIVQELTTRPVFILVISPAALASGWVVTEFNMAFNQLHEPAGKLIIPVLYQSCEPRADMMTLQMVSFIEQPYEQAFAEVLSALPKTNASPVVSSLPSPSSMSPLELNLHMLRQQASVKAWPNISPVGGSFAMEPDGRLKPNVTHSIALENSGERSASSIAAVFFPSAMYLDPAGASQHGPTLLGTYWRGELGVSLSPGVRSSIVMQEARAPLRGTDRILPQHTLYAPEQPKLGTQLVGAGRFYSARLTITYRDTSGIRLATVSDFDATRFIQNLDPWRQIEWPTEVEDDLVELTDWCAAERQPPRFGS